MFDISLLIKLFISLIELGDPVKTSKEHTCRFKIDKTIYSKRSLEQRATLANISLQRILLNFYRNCSVELLIKSLY